MKINCAMKNKTIIETKYTEQKRENFPMFECQLVEHRIIIDLIYKKINLSFSLLFQCIEQKITMPYDTEIFTW